MSRPSRTATAPGRSLDSGTSRYWSAAVPPRPYQLRVRSTPSSSRDITIAELAPIVPIAWPRNPSATSLTVRAPVSSTASESSTRWASAVVRTRRCWPRSLARALTSARAQIMTQVVKRSAQSRSPRLPCHTPDATDSARPSAATPVVRRVSA